MSTTNVTDTTNGLTKPANNRVDSWSKLQCNPLLQFRACQMNRKYFVPPEQCVNPNSFVICVEVQKKYRIWKLKKKCCPLYWNTDGAVSGERKGGGAWYSNWLKTLYFRLGSIWWSLLPHDRTNRWRVQAYYNSLYTRPPKRSTTPNVITLCFRNVTHENVDITSGTRLDTY
jgi:hypothetical protein